MESSRILGHDYSICQCTRTVQRTASKLTCVIPSRGLCLSAMVFLVFCTNSTSAPNHPPNATIRCWCRVQTEPQSVILFSVESTSANFDLLFSFKLSERKSYFDSDRRRWTRRKIYAPHVVDTTVRSSHSYHSHSTPTQPSAVLLDIEKSKHLWRNVPRVFCTCIRVIGGRGRGSKFSPVWVAWLPKMMLNRHIYSSRYDCVWWSSTQTLPSPANFCKCAYNSWRAKIWKWPNDISFAHIASTIYVSLKKSAEKTHGKWEYFYVWRRDADGLYYIWYLCND